MIGFNPDFSKEKRIIRSFTILEGIGLLLSVIIILASLPHAFMVVVAFFMVATSIVAVFLLRRHYKAQPVVREKQPYLDKNAKLQAQLKQQEAILSNETNARNQIRQDEKRATEKRQADHQADLAKYKSQHEQVDRNQRAELDGILKKVQQEHFAKGMRLHTITDASIPGVGPKMKDRLIAVGIRTAADVSLSRVQSIQGFGEAKAQAVAAWRQDVERKLQWNAPKDVPDQLAQPVHDKYEQQHHQIAALEHEAQTVLPGDLAKIAEQAKARQADYDQAVAQAQIALPPLKKQAADLANILEQYKSITFIVYLKHTLGADGKGRTAVGAYAVALFLVIASLFQFTSGGLASAMMVVDSIPTATLTPTATITPTVTPTFTITPTSTLTPTLVPTATLTPTLTSTVTLTPTITLTPTRTLVPTSTRWPTATYVPGSIFNNSGGDVGGSGSTGGNTTSSGGPGGATALCRDGTYSYSQNRSGTCSHHGGVQIWY